MLYLVQSGDIFVVSVNVNFEKLQQARPDYVFHSYGEICNFIYCVLLKTRVGADLPGIHEWEAYMDTSKLDAFRSLPIEEFLMSYPFGKELAGGKTSGVREFRVKCRIFLDHLVVVLLRNVTVTSQLCQGLYSFCPEIMLEGDDSHVFGLFFFLCELLKSGGALDDGEMDAAVEEYHSYIIEKRRHHANGSCSASANPDVIHYLVRDFSFQARVHLFRVFKLCCLIVGMPESVPPPVVIDLSGCALDARAFRDCLLLVQSYILSWGYSHKAFFVDSTLDAVRGAVDTAGVFYVSPDFDLWSGLSSEGLEEFLTQYRSYYREFLLEQQKSFECRYIGLNKMNRESRSRQGSVVSESSGSSCSGSRSKKSEKPKKSAPVVPKPSKNTSAKGSGGASTSKKPKEGSKKGDGDPDVFHKLKKPSSH